jgi:hypothetical protein
MARSRDEVANDAEIAETIYHNARNRTLFAQAFEAECLAHLMTLESELEEIDTEAGAFDDMDESMDGDHESGLASAGFGTDEDYEHNDIDSFDFEEM